MILSPGQDPHVDDVVAQAQSMTTQQLEDRIHALKNEMRKSIADLLDDDDELFQNLISDRHKINSHEKKGTLDSNRALLVVKNEIRNAEKKNYRMSRDMKSSYMKLDALYDELQFRAYRPLMAIPVTVTPSTALSHASEGRVTGTPVAPEPQVTWSRPTASSFMASSSGKVNGSNFSLAASVHATGSLSGAGAGVGTSGTSSIIQSALTSNAKQTITVNMTTNLDKTKSESLRTIGQGVGSGSGSGSQPIIIDLSDSEPEPEFKWASEPEINPSKRDRSVASSVAGNQPRPAKKIRATPTKLKVLARPKKKNPRLRTVTLPKPCTNRTESFQQVWSELQLKASEHTTQTTLMEPSFKSLTMETFGKHGQTMPTFQPLETTKNVVFSTKEEVLEWKWLRPAEDQTEILYFSNWKIVPEDWKPSDIITHYNVARKRKEAIFFEMMAIITLLLNRDEAKRLKLVFFAEENSLQSLLNPLMHSRQHLVRMAWCTRDFEVYRVCGLDPKKHR
ncbi:hypothetical protein BG000_009544 [Podila horticola]|nr:hypothetical protein BG000_009544 [Podila horticola]